MIANPLPSEGLEMTSTGSGGGEEELGGGEGQSGAPGSHGEGQGEGKGGEEEGETGGAEEVKREEEHEDLEEQAGAEETKGEERRQEDWEENICEMSGLPYYWSPSRRRASWTAPGTSPDEDAELDEVYAERPSGFADVSPMHADGTCRDCHAAAGRPSVGGR